MLFDGQWTCAVETRCELRLFTLAFFTSSVSTSSVATDWYVLHAQACVDDTPLSYRESLIGWVRMGFGSCESLVTGGISSTIGHMPNHLLYQ